MDLLRFITAGSVDDGKSTLIGRLLYDSKSILSDQLEAIERSSKNLDESGVDLALLTDGLRAEREQGITIDVAYRYFTTPKRKFIIADAPGHVQYTRNMITGASNADAIIILIDARQGVLEQTRRHTIIASLLKLKHVIVAINKMDLVGYSEERFMTIKEQFNSIAFALQLGEIHFLPISAKLGDNVVNTSNKMPWYNGDSVLELLEKLEIQNDKVLDFGRFQVQFVIRPQTAELHDYRGYAGRISSGIYKKGDAVGILPINRLSVITKIEIDGKEVGEAFEGQSVIVHLQDDIDISRGDMIVSINEQPLLGNEFEAVMCWMDEKQLQEGNRYILQHGSRQVRAIVKKLQYRLDVNSLEKKPVEDAVRLNELVKVTLKTSAPIAIDFFEVHKETGSAILIDETANSTVAAIMFTR